MYATDNEDGVGTVMRPLAELLAARLKNTVPTARGRAKPPNRERIALIEELLVFMLEDLPTAEEDALLKQSVEAGTKKYLERMDRRIKYYLGRLKGRPDSWIRDTMKQARTGSNPPALFNFLLKKELSTQPSPPYAKA